MFIQRYILFQLFYTQGFPPDPGRGRRSEQRERGPFRALKMRPVRQEAVHSLWSRLFCGPLKMRRVPQEAFLSTARIFRTIGGPLRYRMPQSQKGERHCLQLVSQIPKRRSHCLQRVSQIPKMRKALPAANATTARKEEGSAKSVARLTGENKKRTTRKIVLFPIWGAMWGSNPRHPEPQSGALPTELIAPCQFGVTKVQRFFGIAREYSKKELSLCDWNKNRIGEYVKRD